MLTFDKWLADVPETITSDPLWKMKAYRLATFLSDLAWYDTSKVITAPRTMSLADQLYRAAGSIGANIAEGYSRRTGKDRSRFYEYALGSARETRHWYFSARRVLPKSVIEHRIQLLTEVSRLLLAIIPQERTRNLAEQTVTYETELSPRLANAPLP